MIKLIFLDLKQTTVYCLYTNSVLPHTATLGVRGVRGGGPTLGGECGAEALISLPLPLHTSYHHHLPPPPPGGGGGGGGGGLLTPLTTSV